MLAGFRGKCPLRVYIASKPSKYGIKEYAMRDAKSFYNSNMEVYTGQQLQSLYKVDNSDAVVVKRQITPIANTGRNVKVRPDLLRSVSKIRGH